jgi:hypothetical protein
MDRAFHRPTHFAALRDRLKRLTDADLTSRYRAVLRGETPPCIFAEADERGQATP